MTEIDSVLERAGGVLDNVGTLREELKPFDLPGVNSRKYSKDTAEAFERAKRNAQLATLGELTGLLLASADEIYRRLWLASDSTSTQAEG